MFEETKDEPIKSPFWVCCGCNKKVHPNNLEGLFKYDYIEADGTKSTRFRCPECGYQLIPPKNFNVAEKAPDDDTRIQEYLNKAKDII